jgi:anti-anti-sigma factor
VNISCDWLRVGSVEVVQITGELDAETGKQLLASVESRLADQHPLVLDLTRVTFTDCRGLSVLLAIGRRARRSGGWARAAGVVGPTAALFDVFDVWPVLGGRNPVDLEVRRALGAAAAEAPLRPLVASAGEG